MLCKNNLECAFFLIFISTFLIDDFLKFQIWVIGAFTRYHIFSNFYTIMHLQHRYVKWPSINTVKLSFDFLFLLTFSWYDSHQTVGWKKHTNLFWNNALIQLVCLYDTIFVKCVLKGKIWWKIILCKRSLNKF
jgi:hypothetical protein